MCYYFLNQSNGITRYSIGKHVIENIFVPEFSIHEQKAIADYLDRKTEQIDTLTEKKQKQIELLKEQRTAIINQAVTKGLNPDVTMKDSGWPMIKLYKWCKLGRLDLHLKVLL